MLGGTRNVGCVTVRGVGPADRIERSQWDFFWVPDGVEVLDRPDVAALRSDKDAPHQNMVTRTRPAPGEEHALVAEMTGWLGDANARWLVPDTFERAPVERALEAHRWSPSESFEARAIRPDDYAIEPPDLEVRRIDRVEMLAHAWAIASKAFDRDLTHTPEELEAELAQCASPSGRVHRYLVYLDGEPVSSGGFNLFEDLGFAFLWAGSTVPDARGRGAYTALVARRLRDAKALGVEWVGLYAKLETSAPIVAKQGFERFGEMTFWAPEGKTG